MKRIAVIGCSGSGKSTMAVLLAAILGYPIIHLDRLYWLPGWLRRPTDEWIRMQQELVSQDTWLMDGHFFSTIDIRLAAADTVIWVEAPRWLCAWRAFWRAVRGRWQRRPDLAEGCHDRIDWKFLYWIWRYPIDESPVLQAKLDALPPSVNVIRLRNSREVANFLSELKQQKSAFDVTLNQA